MAKLTDDADYDAGETCVRSLVRRMAKLTDDADYDAGETFENVLVRRMASLTDDADYDAGETSENAAIVRLGRAVKAEQRVMEEGETTCGQSSERTAECVNYWFEAKMVEEFNRKGGLITNIWLRKA
ncbi:unnamed protein product [Protopolystoma xenopodis]|uniref:Uncharacterized protein n=1 Tax=Protopolystoma xenopodis TaxID=117903 RepID=A0A448X488_9PLAT|nr:unnamed protein product [Protopolystoma xenopodis]